MYRYIIIFNFHIKTYTLFILIGLFFSIFFSIKNAERFGYSKERIFEAWVYILFFGIIIGGRLEGFLFYWKYFLKDPLFIFKNVGVSTWGIGISVFFTLLIFCKIRKINIWKLLDFLFPYMMLFLSIGRIGCFFNGCCFGKVCTWCGIKFPALYLPPVYVSQVNRGLIPPNSPYSLPVVPTQLLFSLNTFLSFWLGRKLYNLQRIKGESSFFTFFAYGTGRFFIEFFRYVPSEEYVMGPITKLQIKIFSALIIFGVIYFVRKKLYKNQVPS